jgi:hypothetical protein
MVEEHSSVDSSNTLRGAPCTSPAASLCRRSWWPRASRRCRRTGTRRTAGADDDVRRERLSAAFAPSATSGIAWAQPVTTMQQNAPASSSQPVSTHTANHEGRSAGSGCRFLNSFNSPTNHLFRSRGHNPACRPSSAARPYAWCSHQRSQRIARRTERL